MHKIAALAGTLLLALTAGQAEAHTWYCGHGTLWTSPGAQAERFGGHYPNGDHSVSTIRVSPSGTWYVVDTHRRYCHS